MQMSIPLPILLPAWESIFTYPWLLPFTKGYIFHWDYYNGETIAAQDIV